MRRKEKYQWPKRHQHLLGLFFHSISLLPAISHPHFVSKVVVDVEVKEHVNVSDPG